MTSMMWGTLMLGESSPGVVNHVLGCKKRRCETHHKTYLCIQYNLGLQSVLHMYVFIHKVCMRYLISLLNEPNINPQMVKNFCEDRDVYVLSER